MLSHNDFSYYFVILSPNTNKFVLQEVMTELGIITLFVQYFPLFQEGDSGGGSEDQTVYTNLSFVACRSAFLF